jgi:hypothetical protein
MPIKPQNRARYPANWKEIVDLVRRRSGNRCEGSPAFPACRVHNGALGGRSRDGAWHPAYPLGEKLLRLEWPKPGDIAMCHDGVLLRIIRIVLTTAHLDHVPEHCDLDNLRHWCQRCHLLYDQAHHRATAHHTRRQRKAMADLFQEAA